MTRLEAPSVCLWNNHWPLTYQSATRPDDVFVLEVIVISNAFNGNSCSCMSIYNGLPKAVIRMFYTMETMLMASGLITVPDNVFEGLSLDMLFPFCPFNKGYLISGRQITNET